VITQSRLQELLTYDPDSGLFNWNVTRGKVQSGSVAGNVTARGYIKIALDGKGYLAHRLAFLYVEGAMPSFSVDHINMNKVDNRWVNLRQATRSENLFNRGLPVNNKSGVKGVYWIKASSKWRATGILENKHVHLGLFNDINQAAIARMEFEMKHHKEFRHEANK
jgi:hypothetical protein